MAMMDPLDNLKAALGAMVWGAALSALPPRRRGAVKCLRIGHMLLREIAEGTLTLRAASLVPRSAKVVKILGRGELGIKLTVRAHRFSKSAQEKIEKAGGKAVLAKGEEPAEAEEEAPAE